MTMKSKITSGCISSLFTALVLGAAMPAVAQAVEDARSLNGVYEAADGSGKVVMMEGVLYNDAEVLSMAIKGGGIDERNFRTVRRPYSRAPFVFQDRGNCVVTFTFYSEGGAQKFYAEAVPATCEGDETWDGFSANFVRYEGDEVRWPW